MDQETFEQEILSKVEVDQIAMCIEGILQHIRDLPSPNPTNRLANYHMIQAALAYQADRMNCLDQAAPDFREHLRAYRSLQTSLFNDLNLIMKHPGKKITLFKHLL